MQDVSERRSPRALWPALAAAAAVVVIVAGAFYVMSGSPSGGTSAQGPSGGATASVLDPSSPPESEDPLDSPTPTLSETPTPTPTTTSATPTPTPTRKPSTRSSQPRPTTQKPSTGTLSVGSCTIRGAGPGSCTILVRAVGGTVTWSVTGASDGLQATGGGTLRSGQTAFVRVSGTCTPPGGTGTVSFSTGNTGGVTLSCPTDGGPGGGGDGGNGGG